LLGVDRLQTVSLELQKQRVGMAEPFKGNASTDKHRQSTAGVLTRVIAMSTVGYVEPLNCRTKFLPAGRSNSTIL
jgi:hypothetical protein